VTSRADRLLAIVPAFNEEATVGHVVRSLLSLGHDVLVVNDGSIDQTPVYAAREGAVVLSLPVNLGVGGALRAGFRYAVEKNYQAVVQIDADGQHPVAQIGDLQRAAREHRAQLVIGSRFLSTASTLKPSTARRVSMSLLAYICTYVAGTKLTDSTSGFRVICEPLLSAFSESFPDYYLGDTFEATVAAARAGYRITEVPAALAPRIHGESSASVIQSIRLIAKVLVVSILHLHPSVRGINQLK